jgi:hypothetical protein
VAFCLHAEIAPDGVLKRPAECLLILALDGLEVGIGPAEQHIVQHFLLCAWAAHGVVQGVAVVQERSLDQGDQALLKPAARLREDVLLQTAVEKAVVGRPERLYLEGILGGEDTDQLLLVGAKALHGRSQSLRVRSGIPGDVLGRAVTQACRGRRAAIRRRGSAVLLSLRGVAALRRVRATTMLRRELAISRRRCSVRGWGAILSLRRGLTVAVLALRRRRLAIAILLRRGSAAGGRAVARLLSIAWLLSVTWLLAIALLVTIARLLLAVARLLAVALVVLAVGHATNVLRGWNGGALLV